MKRVSGCTAATLRIYERWIGQSLAVLPVVGPLEIRRFFAGLQSLAATSQHQAYRTLKTFFRWCVETGVLEVTPLRGFTMRTPKTLPNVPTDDELLALLRACSDTFEGIRNRTLRINTFTKMHVFTVNGTNLEAFLQEVPWLPFSLVNE